MVKWWWQWWQYWPLKFHDDDQPTSVTSPTMGMLKRRRQPWMRKSDNWQKYFWRICKCPWIALIHICFRSFKIPMNCLGNVCRKKQHIRAKKQQKDLLGVLLSSTSIIYSSHHRYQIPCTIIWNIEYLHQQSDRLHQLYPPAEQLTFYPHQKFAPKLKQSIVGNFLTAVE